MHVHINPLTTHTCAKIVGWLIDSLDSRHTYVRLSHSPAQNPSFQSTPGTKQFLSHQTFTPLWMREGKGKELWVREGGKSE